MKKSIARFIGISLALHALIPASLLISNIIKSEEKQESSGARKPEKIKDKSEPQEIEIIADKGPGKKPKHLNDKCLFYYGGIGIVENLLSGEVTTVYPGYPAAENDIRPGDIISNNNIIRGPVGEEIKLYVYRSGKLIIKTLIRDKICIDEPQ